MSVGNGDFYQYLIPMGYIDNFLQFVSIDIISLRDISSHPATDYIEITQPFEDLKPSEGFVVRIYNVFGEVVYPSLNPSPAGRDFSGNSSSQYSLLNTQYPMKLDVSCLPAGVYFVRVGERVGKFVKI